MFKKLFGGKKEFYVQLDENQASETVAAVVTEKTQETVQEVSAPAKTSTKKKSGKKTAKTSAPVETPEPVAVAPAPKAKVDPSQVAFASADPIPQNMARRNPGPSFNRFKEMARQVKPKAR